MPLARDVLGTDAPEIYFISTTSGHTCSKHSSGGRAGERSPHIVPGAAQAEGVGGKEISVSSVKMEDMLGGVRWDPVCMDHVGNHSSGSCS